MRNAQRISRLKELVNNIRETIFGKVDMTTFYFPLLIADMLFSLHKLLSIIENFNITENESNWAMSSCEFLSERWSKIGNTPLCYTQNTELPINRACYLLAEICADLTGSYINKILMPTVDETDIFRNELKNQEKGTFIISDSKQQFICLSDLADTAIERLVKFDKSIFVICDQYDQERELTDSEMSRIKWLRDELTKFSIAQLKNKTLLEELAKLRNGLLRGDALHQGSATNAGKPANIAIVDFFEFYNRLSHDGKVKIRQLKSRDNIKLGQILNALDRDPSDARNNGNPNVYYCIQLLGGHLDKIIEDNRNEITGFSDFDEKVQEFKQNIKRKLATPKSVSPHHHSGNSYSFEFSITNLMNETLTDSINSRQKLFLLLFDFVKRECHIKFAGKLYDTKFKYYLDLIIAIKIETSFFNTRTSRDNIAVLQEIVTRLCMLTYARSTYYNFFHFPQSEIRWQNFANENSILLAELHIETRSSRYRDISKYQSLYPLPTRTILNEQIISERAVALQ